MENQIYGGRERELSALFEGNEDLIMKIKNPDGILLNILLNADDNADNSSTSSSSSILVYEECLLTRIVIIPCLITMFLSSILLIFLIRKYLRGEGGTSLYFSVIIYSCSQIILFAVIVLDIILASWSLKSLLFCQMRSTSEIFVLVLSAYSILVMTGVRFVFIHRPLHYRTILKLKYQWFLELIKLIFTAALALSPLMGLCPISIEDGTFCHLESSTKSCIVFHVLGTGLGIILPLSVTVCLYFVIYRTVMRLRASQKWLEPSVPSSSLSRRTDRSSEGTLRSASAGTLSSKSLKHAVSQCAVGTCSTHMKHGVSPSTDILINQVASQLNRESIHTGSSCAEERNRLSEKEVVEKLSEDKMVIEEGRKSPVQPVRKCSSTRKFCRENTITPFQSSISDDLVLTESALLPSTCSFIDSAHNKRMSLRKSLHQTSSNITRVITMRRFQRTPRTKVRESRAVPWSIMVVLILYIITTMPWITLIVAPHLWFAKISGELRLALDLKYAVMFFGVACSPIATIFTNKILRKSFWRWVYSLKKRW